MPEPHIHDVLGVGFGPANLAIALREKVPEKDCRFLEAKARAGWQSGMLLRGADIQNYPVRALVTLRDPRSRFTFVNYLHELGRLLAYLNVPAHFPLRREYAGYVEWVADQLADVVQYDCAVRSVRYQPGEVPHYVVSAADGSTHRGRSLVIASGRTPCVPPVFAGLLGDKVFHTRQYLGRLAARVEGGGSFSLLALRGQTLLTGICKRVDSHLNWEPAPCSPSVRPTLQRSGELS